MTEGLESLETEFLKTHRLGVLATSKNNGAPQVTLISYNYDGKDIVISTGDQSAKLKNASKRPEIALIVSEGPKAVIVYGSAEIVRGADALSLREERLPRPPLPPGAPPRVIPTRGESVILRFAPDKVLSTRLQE